MGVQQTDYYSISDYISMEESSVQKHGYEQGAILAISGGTYNHGVLCGNFHREISNGIEDNAIEIQPKVMTEEKSFINMES